MHKLTIQLKQHTPILHFQHDQVGATLRATEVKPKLDKFLIQHAYQNKFDDYKEFLQGYKGESKDKMKHEAFAYQLSFTAKEIQMSDRNNLPGYFAEIGNKGEVGKKLSFAEGLQMHIKSRKAKLLEVIKENINSFLMQHNFGTRQSRGFGSFTVHPEDKLYKPVALDYRFEVDNYTSAKFDQWKNLFNNIDLFARSLRAGLNLKGKGAKTTYYFKSLAFIYAKNVLDAQWDKKTIKENFFPTFLIEQQAEHNQTDILSYKGKELLVKDLFGLSTVESWYSYKGSIVKESKKENDGKKAIVERFQSPILFKPTKKSNGSFSVHFNFKTISEKMLDQTFTVDFNLKKDQRPNSSSQKRKKSNKAFQIKTPSVFDFNEFFEYILNNVDIDDHVDSIYHGAPEHNILDNIYAQLKEQ